MITRWSACHPLLWSFRRVGYYRLYSDGNNPTLRELRSIIKLTRSQVLRLSFFSGKGSTMCFVQKRISRNMHQGYWCEYSWSRLVLFPSKNRVFKCTSVEPPTGLHGFTWVQVLMQSATGLSQPTHTHTHIYIGWVEPKAWALQNKNRDHLAATMNII